MEILKRFQAERYVRQLQNGTRLADSQLQEAHSQLVSMGSPAVRAVFSALGTNPASSATLDALSALASERTLPAYLDALRSAHATVADAATRALANSTDYAPAPLLALYADDRVSRARLETILDAQSARLDPGELMKLLPELGKEARNSAFRLLDKAANESVVREAIALTHHEDWWLRLHMAKLLARFPGEHSNAAVSRLVRDENGAVRLEAVRAVTRLQAAEAIPALCSRLRDQDMKVQSAAIEALVAMADVSAVPRRRTRSIADVPSSAIPACDAIALRSSI